MTQTKRVLLVAAAVVAGSWLLAVVFNLPTWIAALVATVVLIALAVLWKQEKAVPMAAPAPPVPRPAEREPVFTAPPTRTVAGVRLPSASPDYHFSFSAIVQWSPVMTGLRHADLGSVAVDALLSRAKALAAGQQPFEEALNQHRLAALLGEPDLDEKGQVRTWATDVRLKLPDADFKHLQNITALQRRAQTLLLERQLEQDKRAYLRDDVLATPGSAVVWWLANNPGEVAQCVDLLGTLTRLSAAANDISLEALERRWDTDLGTLALVVPELSGNDQHPDEQSQDHGENPSGQG
ncbi:hypothetical protein [Kribbella sp. CA-293567]|uniref:hypothetical protein n=1 Tax=Kribbella sp. CA-293567 TaxID=3002436 RepID=UPI0022DD25E8|nr:hypothetical protein [Kribbella sp. CA-293567]WBQ07768.1 hypothetical protein OX958_13430 [Kribbella sp. CA-293567]